MKAINNHENTVETASRIRATVYDERNFRSAYYEKVGFRSVEEKRSLEILLKDKPLDRAKLKEFCLRFSVPSTYRNLLWKLLLGVVPMHLECHSFIMEQRQQEYKDLLRALQITRTVDINTPKPQLFLAMWMLQNGNLHFESSLQLDCGFALIAHSLMQFFEDDTDVYWLSKCFYDHVKKFQGDIPKLIESTWSLLEKDDPVLYEHLQTTGILKGIPIEKWFDSCFAGVLAESALAKIWDKLCGGSYKVLVFVVVVLFINQKHKLLKCHDVHTAIQCLVQVPEETADAIANKTIDIWQQHGSPLTVHDKPKP